MPGFAKIAAPLNQRLKNDEARDFELDEREQEAVDIMKSKLASPPILALPKATGKFVVDSDARKPQQGCVLLQEQKETQIKPVDNWSRSLNIAEWNYNTSHKEYLVVVWSLVMLRTHLKGTHFVVRTDH